MRLCCLYGSGLILLLIGIPLIGQTVDDFTPQVYGAVYSLAIQPDGKILIGGEYVLSRLDMDGTPDPTFSSSGLPYLASCLAVQADQKILVGGTFSQLRNEARSNLGRLNPDGSLDSSFNPNANDIVNCCALQADGKILVGGRFTVLAGYTSLALARLNTNGTLDTNFTFSAETFGTVNSIALQADGKIVVGGIFSASGSGQQRANLSRLNADGSADMNFNPGVNGWVEALAIEPDGKIILGGCFGSVGGQPRTNIARLNPDGTVDLGFNPGAGVFTQPGSGSSFVFSLALQADGKILVGGFFDTLGGQPCYALGRLQANGELDSGFTAGANSFVYSLALQLDGKILAGGSFSQLGGTNREYVGRLDNTVPAVETLTNDNSVLTWNRSGSCPELQYAGFEVSSNGVVWSSLGPAFRVPGGWQLGQASVNPNEIVRARGYVAGGEHGGSGWLTEKVLSGPTTNQPSLDLRLTGRIPIITVRGDAGRPYVIEFTPLPASADSWQPLTFLLLTNSWQNFTDPSGSNVSLRFYRARLDQ